MDNVQLDQPASPSHVDFDIKSYAPLLATAYGEAANQDYNSKVRVISTMFNRALSGKREFGADTGKITDVLKGYYAYSKQSPKYQEALSQKFPDKASEDSYKQIVAITSGILRGKIDKTTDEFFITPAEAKKTKMNMSLLEKTGSNKVWNFYRYKPSPATKGKKVNVGVK